MGLLFQELNLECLFLLSVSLSYWHCCNDKSMLFNWVIQGQAFQWPCRHPFCSFNLRKIVPNWTNRGRSVHTLLKNNYLSQGIIFEIGITRATAYTGWILNCQCQNLVRVGYIHWIGVLTTISCHINTIQFFFQSFSLSTEPPKLQNAIKQKKHCGWNLTTYNAENNSKGKRCFADLILLSKILL